MCTGTVILGTAGVLQGRKATTHHLYFDLLSEVCALSEAGVEVLKGKRWVNAEVGETMHKVRIITVGGISYGLDSSVFVVRN